MIIYEKNIVNTDDELNDNNNEEKLSAVSVFKNNSSTIKILTCKVILLNYHIVQFVLFINRR